MPTTAAAVRASPMRECPRTRETERRADRVTTIQDRVAPTLCDLVRTLDDRKPFCVTFVRRGARREVRTEREVQCWEGR
jgi:hypothetical protein